MPQASEDLCKRWNGPSEHMAIKHLKGAGYLLTAEWEWLCPKGRTPTEEDQSAILFLIQEWDYGGLLLSDPRTHAALDEKRAAIAPYECKFCGAPSWRAPSEQEMPPDYCHPEDHGSPEDMEEELSEALSLLESIVRTHPSLQIVIDLLDPLVPNR